MQFTRNIILSLSATCLLSTQVQAAEEKEAPLPNWKEESLTSDWGGARADLYKKGIDLGFSHRSDFLANTSGGVKRGSAWLGRTDARLSLDLEKLWGWSGTSAFVGYQSLLGSKFNTHYVGAFMGVDNTEAATNTAMFYQAWLQKNWLDDRVSVLAGLYQIDAEFYVTETSGVFVQPPYGMANDLAQAGVSGPPVFPLGALATRLKLTSSKGDFYVQAALTEGIPGDPDHLHGTHIKLGRGEGTLSIVELGYKPQPAEVEAEVFNKTAIGYWRYSTYFDSNDGLSRKHNQGAYVLSEQTLYAEKGQSSQGLSGFVRFGVATDAVNVADWTGSAGLRYHGLIAGRDDDVAGIAVTVNHAGDSYRRVNGSERQETDFEATYRAQVTPYFAIQPTIQYIKNPSMDAVMQNVWVLGTRFDVEF